MLLRHPDLAMRDCNDCLVHVYDEKTGEPMLHRGKPLPRPRGTFPPCHYGRCKKGSPDSFTSLLPQNWQAYEHYLECKATSQFPDDDIVRHNARIISEVEQTIHRVERKEDVAMNQVLLMQGSRR